MLAVFALFGTAGCRPSSAPRVALAPSPVATAAALPPVVEAPRVASAPTKARVAPSSDEVERTVVSVFGDTAALHPDSASATNIEPVWDIDVRSYETHERVAHYVQLFSTTSREHFTSRLSRGTRYEPMIRAKLRASGMPEDLTYLALIESGFDPHAYSRAAAVGMWQFMSSTARDVGLRVDWWMDERRDPVRSTDGAIRFLADLQKQFGSLYLAAAAYNGGPGRVARGLTRFASELEGADSEDRFFVLAEQDYLRPETKNYVPQIIAAALIGKMPSRYGLAVDSTAPLSYDSVHVGAGTSLAAVAAASASTPAVMKDLNPSILRGVTPPDTGIWVHVPTGSGPSAAAALDTLSSDARRGFRTLRVSGSTTTPAAIAEREGVTLKQLRWYNPGLKTTRKGRLVAGQSVRVPDLAVLPFARELPDPSIERYGSTSPREMARSGVHVVRRGESLAAVANRYGLTVARLKALNGIRGAKLIAGQTLRVRASGGATASSKTSRSSSGSTSSAKKSSKKSSAKKSSAKKSTAKKSTAKKSTAKKSSAKKSSPKPSSAAAAAAPRKTSKTAKH